MTTFDIIGTQIALEIGGPAYALEIRERVNEARRRDLADLLRPRPISDARAAVDSAEARVASARTTARLASLLSDEDRFARAWDLPRGSVTYAMLPPGLVDPRIRHSANLARTFAAAHLGISEPRMGFYRLETESLAAARASGEFGELPTFRSSDHRGHAHPSSTTIGVRIDTADPLSALETSAHEVLHIVQGEAAREDAAEAEADAYGVWAAELLSYPDAGRRRVAERVHVVGETPWRCQTLAGVARHGDVLIATGGNEGSIVYRNTGWSQPDWVRHYRQSPVSLARRP